MKKVVFLVFVATLLNAQWSSVYSYGSSIADENKKINYDKLFGKSVDKDSSIYDESSRNDLAGSIVEVEDKKIKNNNFFYSTNKRDYYKKSVKKYKVFKGIDF
jgi:hypothetical protein